MGVTQLFLTIVSNIGFGAIISSLVTIHYQKKKFTFETKLTKYSNLIQAYQDCISNSDETRRQNFVSNQKQVELIGTDKIIALSQKFYVTNANIGASIRDELVNAMREDLRKYL